MISNILPLLLFLKIVSCSQHNYSSRIRGKRTLIFPPTSPTRVQFIYGIGIPLVDLDVESLTTGYVLKAEYFLPTKAIEFRPTQLTPQDIGYIPNSKRDLSKYNKTDAGSTIRIKLDMHAEDHHTKKHQYSVYRWAVYEGFKTLINRAGYDGKACLLRSICEIGAVPFHPNSGLLAELMHIIMSPSSSNDIIGKHEHQQYYMAEKLGQNGAPCDTVFKECHTSVLENFSFTRELLQYFG